MIQLQSKQDCCGCAACVQRCPKQCITMIEDEEGFLYPHVDTASCIDCGLCEKVCPVIHRDEPREPLEVFAAKNPNEEIRRRSSSGGMFTLLAEQTISNGGVVFGARFNDKWEVEHAYSETIEEIATFRGSKYVQSHIGNTFRQAEQFLKSGREVLFSGTPCQIAGLRRFLRKDYPNLLTIDCICHSIPSPGIWRKYLTETLKSNGKELQDISTITFRDKIKGWKDYHFTISLRNGKPITRPAANDSYIRGFLHDLYTRPSCAACPAKRLSSGSDITLGDYWGIDTLIPGLDDDRGVSAITINTQHGLKIFHTTHAELHSTTYSELISRNPALVRSIDSNIDRATFYNRSAESVAARVIDLCRHTLYQNLRRLAFRISNHYPLLHKLKRAFSS